MNNGRRWPEEVKAQARKMRLDGATYGEIQKRFLVAKSTLGVWFGGLPYPDHVYFTNRDVWMRHIRELSSKTKKAAREEKVSLIMEKAKKEVEKWSFLQSVETQKVILSMLYWAEGQKLPEKTAPLSFANTDPRLMLLFLTVLRNCYVIDEKRLRVRIYVHWYHNVTETKRFWSKLLGVDLTQFRKTYLKKRGSKSYRKNFMGICFVNYGSVYLRREIEYTGHNIQRAITGIIPYSR